MSKGILLGAIIGAQGLKGEVKVKTFTETPESLGAYGALHSEDGRVFKVASARAMKSDVAIARFEGIADRDAAEALKGVQLFVHRDQLPATQAEEFYHADLIGLSAEDSEGRLIGTVLAIHNYGAGDVIEIARTDGGNLLLPFTREFAPTVDVKGGRLVIAVPEETETGEKGNVE
ncbi:MAG TPA: ribosome maturation factor RimM [Rhizomicrobium sp.]|nr:ribosome maturation factor RimM [Rhizomicrobium sp.]